MSGVMWALILLALAETPASESEQNIQQNKTLTIAAKVRLKGNGGACLYDKHNKYGSFNII